MDLLPRTVLDHHATRTMEERRGKYKIVKDHSVTRTMQGDLLGLVLDLEDFQLQELPKIVKDHSVTRTMLGDLLGLDLLELPRTVVDHRATKTMGESRRARNKKNTLGSRK